MKKKSFWENKKLNELSNEEWEALCDRCGKCCVIKLIDEETNLLYYTNVSCHLFNSSSCNCNDYKNRKRLVKDCVKLNPESLDSLKWLPNSCSYKLIHEGKKLPNWHPLIQGNRIKMEKGKHSVKGRVISEKKIKNDNFEEYIFDWNKENNLNNE